MSKKEKSKALERKGVRKREDDDWLDSEHQKKKIEKEDSQTNLAELKEEIGAIFSLDDIKPADEEGIGEVDAISALLNLGQIATKIDNQMKEGERRSMIKNSRVEWKDNEVSSADNSIDSSSEALDDRGFPMASDSKKAKNTTTIPEPITQIPINTPKNPIVSFISLLHQKQQHQQLQNQLAQNEGAPLNKSKLAPNSKGPNQKPIVKFDRPSFPLMGPGTLNINPVLVANGETINYERCMTHVAIAKYIYYNQCYTTMIKEKERALHVLKLEQRQMQRQMQKQRQKQQQHIRQDIHPEEQEQQLQPNRPPQPRPQIPLTNSRSPSQTPPSYIPLEEAEQGTNVIQLIQRSRLLLEENNYHSIAQKEEQLKLTKPMDISHAKFPDPTRPVDTNHTKPLDFSSKAPHVNTNKPNANYGNAYYNQYHSNSYQDQINHLPTQTYKSYPSNHSYSSTSHHPYPSNHSNHSYHSMVPNLSRSYSTSHTHQPYPSHQGYSSYASPPTPSYPSGPSHQPNLSYSANSSNHYNQKVPIHLHREQPR